LFSCAASTFDHGGIVLFNIPQVYFHAPMPGCICPRSRHILPFDYHHQWMFNENRPYTEQWVLWWRSSIITYLRYSKCICRIQTPQDAQDSSCGVIGQNGWKSQELSWPDNFCYSILVDENNRSDRCVKSHISFFSVFYQQQWISRKKKAPKEIKSNGAYS